MQDKEKQIEEMAKDLNEVETDVGHILVNETFSYVKEHKNTTLKKDFFNAHTKTFEELTAEEMFKKGYRKINKDSVVISQKEYEKLIAPRLFIKPRELNKKELAEKLKNEKYGIIGVDSSSIEIIPTRADIEKETAEKILKPLYDACKEDTYGQTVVDFAILENFAKQFGVDLGE